MQAPVPERCDRRTLKYRGNDEGHSGDNNPSVHCMAGDAERVVRYSEDAIVQTDNRDFVEHEDDFVHNVRGIEPFARFRPGVGCECVPVSAITIYHSCHSLLVMYSVDQRENAYLDTLSGRVCLRRSTL